MASVPSFEPSLTEGLRSPGLQGSVAAVEEGGQRFGRLGVTPETPEGLRERLFVEVRHGVGDSLLLAVGQLGGVVEHELLRRCPGDASSDCIFIQVRAS